MHRVSSRSRPRDLIEADGPFRYVYVSVSAVPGLKLPQSASDTLRIRSFAELEAQAVLTNNADPYTLHIDRGTAIGALLLTGLVGRSRFKTFAKYWRKVSNLVFGEYSTFSRSLGRETAKCRTSRLKEHSGPGTFLVYIAQGALLEPANLRAARRIGDIGFGFDIIDGEKYRATHRRAVHSTSTALSLALTESTGSPETRFLADTVYLTGPGGLVVYCKTITAGTVGLVTTNQNYSQSVEAAAATVPVLMRDEKLDAAVTLFVLSQKKSNDNLRAFIPAWSALELLINRLSRVYATEWAGVLAGRAGKLPSWDRVLAHVPLEDYRMRDRFFAVACTLGIDSAAKATEDFIALNNKRNGYYHTMDVGEHELPTHQAQSLFRKYLKLALARAAA